MLREFGLVVLVVILSACQVLSPPNTAATLQAEGHGYVATATNVRQTAEAQQTQVMATAAAANTRIADAQRVNQQLLATVRAGATTDPRAPSDTHAVVTPQNLEAGQRWFVKTGTSTQIRDSDGCVIQPQIQFSVDVPRIYATVHVFNIQSGVRMGAEWSYEGTVVLTENWTVPQSSADLCMWFDITPQTVSFQPGSWSVKLFADGFQLEEAMTFSMVAS